MLWKSQGEKITSKSIDLLLKRAGKFPPVSYLLSTSWKNWIFHYGQTTCFFWKLTVVKAHTLEEFIQKNICSQFWNFDFVQIALGQPLFEEGQLAKLFTAEDSKSRKKDLGISVVVGGGILSAQKRHYPIYLHSLDIADRLG